MISENLYNVYEFRLAFLNYSFKPFDMVLQIKLLLTIG